jgi:hypothetical protein
VHAEVGATDPLAREGDLEAVDDERDDGRLGGFAVQRGPPVSVSGPSCGGGRRRCPGACREVPLKWIRRKN